MTDTNKPQPPSKQEIADDLQSKAQATSRQLKEKGSEQLEQYGSRAAGGMESVAEAAQRAAESLEQSDQTMLSQYVGELAHGISDLANSLRHKNTDEILHDVSRLARENAGLFLLGSVAIGFGLARIAKASERRSYAGNGEHHGWEGYYGVGSSEYEESEGRSAEGYSESSRGQSSFSETEASARPETHAETSYLPEEGSGASTSQQSRAGAPPVESQKKPQPGSNPQRPV